MIPKELEQKIIKRMKDINPELSEIYIEDVMGWMKYFLSDENLVWEAFKYHWERDNK